MASKAVQVLGSFYSPYCNRVQIALNLKSVDFEFVEVSLSSGSKSEILLKTNPVHQKVPVLIHDDKYICESLIIVEYVDEAWTSNGYNILPSDPCDRADARFWAAYFDDKLVPLMKDLRSAQGEAKIAVTGQIEAGIVVLEEAFQKCSKGKAYFGGDNIGYIDIAIGSSMGWILAMQKMSGMKLIEEGKHPGLATWVDKFMSNDAVKDVIPSIDMFIELMKKMQAKAAAPSN